AAQARLEHFLETYYAAPARAILARQAAYAGPIEACAEWLQRWIDAGATHLALRFAGGDQLAQVDEAATRLLPRPRRPYPPPPRPRPAVAAGAQGPPRRLGGGLAFAGALARGLVDYPTRRSPRCREDNMSHVRTPLLAAVLAGLAALPAPARAQTTLTMSS